VRNGRQTLPLSVMCARVLSGVWPLGYLTELEALDLGENRIGDLQPLAGLRRLERLDLRGNRVRDLGPLQAVGFLVWVHVGGSGIEDLRPLESPPGLTVTGRDDLEPPGGGGANWTGGRH